MTDKQIELIKVAIALCVPTFIILIIKMLT